MRNAVGDYVQLDGRQPHIMSALGRHSFLDYIDNCVDASENGGESSFSPIVRHSTGPGSGTAVSADRLQQQMLA